MLGDTALAVLGPEGSALRVLPGLVVLGVGYGAANAALGREAVAHVPAERAAMGSGANNTARNTPTISRGLRTGERFSLALLARPAVISRSTAHSRPSLTKIVETTARCAPTRTSGASVATRCDPRVDEYHRASTRFVLPKPFDPTNTVRPGVSSSSTFAQDRKSRRPR